MKKFLIFALLMVVFNRSASAGFVPPQQDPYWCYEACIDSEYADHVQCVKKCYGELEAGSGPLNECHPVDILQVSCLAPLGCK